MLLGCLCFITMTKFLIVLTPLLCAACACLQVQGTAAEADVRLQLQERYSPAAIKAMIELGVTASGFSRPSSSSRDSSRGSSRRASRPAEAALLAEAPPKR